jgi:hypothetical protein
MSASMGADFPMIPRESTLFSRGCKSTSLGSSPIRSLGRRLHPGHQGGCPGSWLHKGGQERIGGSEAIDFYALSWGIPRKPACNLVETAQRKSQNLAILIRVHLVLHVFEILFHTPSHMLCNNPCFRFSNSPLDRSSAYCLILYVNSLAGSRAPSALIAAKVS